METNHLCECGCGRDPGIWTRNNTRYGWVKGEHRRFVHGHNTRKLDYIIAGEHDCWVWDKSLNDDGYGHMGVRPDDYKPGDGYKTRKAMIVYWERVNGPVPEGLILDHFRCDNRACVRPDHMRPVTNRENTLRGNAPSAWNLAKTHCDHGHEFTPKNTYEYKGSRHCRACGNEAQKRYRKKQMEIIRERTYRNPGLGS